VDFLGYTKPLPTLPSYGQQSSFHLVHMMGLQLTFTIASLHTLLMNTLVQMFKHQFISLYLINHSHIHTYINTYKHTHTHMYIHTHVCTHAWMFVCMYVCASTLLASKSPPWHPSKSSPELSSGNSVSNVSTPNATKTLIFCLYNI